MIYPEFVAHRLEALESNPHIIDGADREFQEKFPPIEDVIASIPAGSVKENFSSDELIEDFRKFYGLDGSGQNMVRHELISYSNSGKSSLRALLGLYQDKKWLFPSDSYGFYFEEASKARVAIRTYDTLGHDGLSDIEAISAPADILITPYPLTPAGKLFTEDDWRILNEWLAVDPERRVIFDAVRLTDFDNHQELFSFFHATKQATIIFSTAGSFGTYTLPGINFSYDADVHQRFEYVTENRHEFQWLHLLLNSEAGKKRRDDVRDFIVSQHGRAVEAGIIPADSHNEFYLFYESNGIYSSKGIEGSGAILAIPTSLYRSSARGAIISTLGI